jgi:chromosome segregation protein
MLPGHPRGKALLAARESIGFAIELVRFDERYRAAFWYVFGDTLVVADLDRARKLMGGVRLVTLDGQLLEPSGAMVGGSVEGRPRSPRREHLEAAAEALRRATAEADLVHHRLGEVRGRLSEVEAALRQVSSASEAGRARMEALQGRRREAHQRLTNLEADIILKAKHRQEGEKFLERARSEREKVQARLGPAVGELEARRAEAVAATPHELARLLQEAQARRLAAAEEALALKARVEGLEAHAKVAAERRAELVGRAAAARERREELIGRASGLEESLGAAEEELQALLKVEASLGHRTEELRKARDEAFKAKGRLEGEIDKVNHRLETRGDFLLGLNTELKVQTAALAAAEEELARYQVNPSEEMPSLEDLRATIGATQAEMDSLGAVNLRALEDYRGRQERWQELTAELSRLHGEKAKLVELVAELTAKKRDGFLRTYAAIQGNFRQVYGELSDGGEAELVLEDPEEPFAGGLVMKVRPPNKKPLRLEALSGGEKGLVSMAFIFALQRFEPSPFYLLDEVDQNLDALNAERVARAVSRHSSRAQFLQVSLRKVTLKEADHLLGVVMGSRGLSEVILKLDLGDVAEEPAVEEVSA